MVASTPKVGGPPIADKQRSNSNVSEASLAAIAPYQWKPGRSGNPAGRPRRKTLTERIADILERDTLEGVEVPEGQVVADVLAETIVREACRGRFAFAKEILDRLEGKVPARIAAPVDGPVVVMVLKNVSMDDLKPR